jgi:Mrp family chromosome partitioning ATPase
MNEMIDKLKLMYDLVIIDNPPVGLVTDGIASLQRADYPIYIFRADYSRRNFIQIVDRLYNENKINKLSIVLNGVDVDRRSYGYNYGYGYGYGYGYTQGYYEDDTNKPKSWKQRLNPLNWFS